MKVPGTVCANFSCLRRNARIKRSVHPGAIGGVALWVAFVPIAGESRFPTWRVLTGSGHHLEAVLVSQAVRRTSR